MSAMEECSEPATAGCSSPVKTVELVKSPPSDRASSPETNCAICLGKPQNKSFTDSCLHQFCFSCLLEWSKVKAECPLCKQSFTSIIHTVRSIEDYEQYYIHPAESRISVDDSIWPTENPFRYRTTVTSYLEYFVRFDTGHIIPPVPPRPSYNWRRRRQNGTSEYRSTIYSLNLWVQRLRDITGRYRESSPEFYRLNPAQIHRLVPWLNRELNVLVQENMMQTVLDNILDLLRQHNIRSLQFREALTPYIRSRTDHFIHEFYSFATSPYDMIGYDRNCNYVNYFNIAHELDSSSSSSDSDVQIVSEAVREHNFNLSSPIPGPSGLYPSIEVVSESDPDDCLIVGSVKPRHERTPEIITLDSDDEMINENIVVREVTVHSSNNENVTDPGPSCSRKLRTKAQKKQFSVKKKDSSSDSDESDRSSVVIDCHTNRRRRISERNVNAHPRIIWYSNSSSSASSSDDDSDAEWNSRKEKKNYKMKKKKTASKKKELVRKKSNSKDSKRKSKTTTKHWKKKICRKNGEDASSSDDSGPIQLPRRRKSVAINSSPEPENRPLHDHDYLLNNPYSPNDIKNFVGGRPKLRSVVVKNEPGPRNTGRCTSSLEEKSGQRSQSTDSSRTSRDENDCENNNPQSSSDQLFSKWRHRRESSHSSVDSSSRNLYDRLADLRTDQWMQRPSTSSNVTWLGRHYIDTYSSLNPVRYNLCNNYTSKGSQQDGQSSNSSSSRQHKRKHSVKDKIEKRKKSS